MMLEPVPTETARAQTLGPEQRPSEEWEDRASSPC